MRIVLYLITALLLAGCSSTNTQRSLKPRQQRNTVINRDESAYVSIPEDGRFGTQIYGGSGGNTSWVIASELSKYMNNVEQGLKSEGFDEALSSAKNGNHKYLVIPSILHWEDRATEWSGIPDRISVKVVIIDTYTTNTVDTTVLDGKSSTWGTGAQTPHDLLKISVAKYTRGLF